MRLAGSLRADMLKGFLLTTFLYCFSLIALAGPPFITDDPNPLDYHHLNIIPSISLGKNTTLTTLGLPNLELDYGVKPKVEINLIVSHSLNVNKATPTTQGLADTQLGVKYLVIMETRTLPQLAFAPIFTLPAGDSNKGLGNGQVGILIPLWLQKTWGSWSSYGGGGYTINTGKDMHNFFMGGIVIQKALTESWILGAELFGQGTSSINNDAFAQITVGGYYLFNPNFNTMLSLGCSILGQSQTYGFFGFTWTI